MKVAFQRAIKMNQEQIKTKIMIKCRLGKLAHPKYEGGSLVILQGSLPGLINFLLCKELFLHFYLAILLKS